jgi:hypothetical protein
MGLQLDETTFLGKRIHGPLQFGLPIERDTAKDCTAYIEEAEGERRRRVLYWAKIENGNWSYVHSTDIACGENVTLPIFAGEGPNASRFAVFEPASNIGNNPRLPAQENQIIPPASFNVVVSCRGRPILKFRARMTKDLTGRLYAHIGESSGTF